MALNEGIAQAVVEFKGEEKRKKNQFLHVILMVIWYKYTFASIILVDCLERMTDAFYLKSHVIIKRNCMPMKIVFSLLFTLTLVNSSICGSLERADSLFANKKYTESFDIYKTIMEQEKQVSSAMLLKMAYIKEGLGNSTDALYYLNLYYLRTADKKVLEKLQSLAEKSGVEGYEFNDFEFFQTIFYKYFAQLLFLVGSLSVFMLALVYYMKIIKKWNPIFPAIIMVLSLTALFYTINFGRSYNKAIVMAPQVLLMSGPSSAAEVLASVEEGSRVTYTNTQDVWTKVAFDNKTGFIKTDKLRAITY